LVREGQQFNARTNGAELFVESWGRGESLICLHGGMGVDSSYLKQPAIINLASETRRVIIYDQRGHGQSERTGSVTYSHQTWCEDLRSLARGRQIKKFALLGHSYGGFLALDFALKHPHLLSHLILVGTSAGPVSPEPPPKIENDEDLARFYKDQWPAFFAGEGRHWDVFDCLTFSATAFMAAFKRELPQFNLAEQVAALRMPVLLVAGEQDHFAPDMKFLHQRIEGSELDVIPGAGHFPFLDNPERFQGSLARFLQK
jgi:proline iminopeptidase